MKYLLILFCLIGLPCFALDTLTPEYIEKTDSKVLMNTLIMQEKELDNSKSFQKDFNIFFLNLLHVGNEFEKRSDMEDVIEKSYPYYVFRNTDLFLKSIYDWTFTIPNTIYLHKKYNRKLTKEWKICLKIYNSKNFMNMHSNSLLDNIDDFFKEYKTLLYLENIPKEIVHYGIIQYEWYINNHMFEDQSHPLHHYSSF